MTQQDFLAGVGILKASGLRMPEKTVLEVWFRTLRNFAKEDFREAVINLIESEKFLSAENFNLIEAIVSRAKRYRYLREQFIRDARTIGCKDCVGGMIHSVQNDYAVVGFCGTCYPEHPNAVDPKIPRQYLAGKEPWKYQGESYIPPHILKEMLKDLVNKMMDPKTDWKKEVEIANQMNEQSQRMDI